MIWGYPYFWKHPSDEKMARFWVGIFKGHFFFNIFFKRKKNQPTRTPMKSPPRKNKMYMFAGFLKLQVCKIMSFNMDKTQALPVQSRSLTLTGCPLEEQAHQVGFRCFRASKPPRHPRGWYIQLKLVEVNHCVGQTFPDVFESTSDRCF